MNEKHYLDYAVTHVNGKGILCSVWAGTFASNAWMQSDEEYRQVLGRRFEAITGDDAVCWELDRKNIRRVKSDEEFETLLAQSCELFQLYVRFMDSQDDDETSRIAVQIKDLAARVPGNHYEILSDVENYSRKG